MAENLCVGVFFFVCWTVKGVGVKIINLLLLFFVPQLCCKTKNVIALVMGACDVTNHVQGFVAIAKKYIAITQQQHQDLSS